MLYGTRFLPDYPEELLTLGRFRGTKITGDIRAFVDRNWAAVREAKDAYWAGVVRSGGVLEALRIADQLRLQAQRIHPGWPTVEDRAADLAAHERLSDLLLRGSGPGRR